MNKILLICINYNSYSCLANFLQSIDEAAFSVAGKLGVDVIVGDASTHKQAISTDTKNINLHIYPIENAGYFGGADVCIEKFGTERLRDYDFVSISNVDLKLSPDFFEKLLALPIGNDIGWIAPRIYRPDRNTEENPMRSVRYSKTELKINILLDKYPILYKIYLKSLRRLRHARRNSQSKEAFSVSQKEIYCGAGHFFLFTRKLATKILPFKYPCFLYGEELYVAELTLTHNMKVVYAPSLYMEVTEASVSTSTIKRKTRNEYQLKSLEFILQKFYE